MKNNNNKTSSSYFNKLTTRLLTPESKPIEKKEVKKEDNKNTFNYFIDKKLIDLKSNVYKKDLSKPKCHERVNTEFTSSKVSFINDINNYSSKKSTIVHNSTLEKPISQNNSIIDKLKKYQLTHKRSISNLDNKIVSNRISKPNNASTSYNKNQESISSRINTINYNSNIAAKSMVSFLKDKIEKKGFNVKVSQNIQKSPDTNFLFTEGNISIGPISSGIKKEYNKLKSNKDFKSSSSLSNSNNMSLAKNQKASINFISKISEKATTSSHFYKSKSKLSDPSYHPTDTIEKEEKKIVKSTPINNKPHQLITINNYISTLKKTIPSSKHKITISSSQLNTTTNNQNSNKFKSVSKDKGEKAIEALTSVTRKTSKSKETPKVISKINHISLSKPTDMNIKLNEERKEIKIKPINVDINLNSNYAEKEESLNKKINTTSNASDSKVLSQTPLIIKPVLNLKKNYNMSYGSLVSITNNLTPIENSSCNQEQKECENKNDHVPIKKSSLNSFIKQPQSLNMNNFNTHSTKEKTSTTDVIGFNEDNILLLENSMLNDKSIIDQTGDYFLKESKKLAEFIKQCKLTNNYIHCRS